MELSSSKNKSFLILQKMKLSSSKIKKLLIFPEMELSKLILFLIFQKGPFEAQKNKRSLL